MTEEKILSVVDRMGLFQVNRLSYRNQKLVKTLKKMVKEGKLKHQRLNGSLSNYFK